jgi:non-ribosomal peptide synthetase component F
VKVFADVLSRVASAFGGISEDPVSRLRLCTSTEAKLIYDDVFTYKEGYSAISVDDAFVQVMQRFPDRLAISNADGSSSMSYFQLDKASMAFTQWLLQQDHVGPGKVIGILYQPNAYLVIVYLACLRAGCAYTVSTEMNQLEDIRTTYPMYGNSDDRRVNA